VPILLTRYRLAANQATHERSLGSDFLFVSFRISTMLLVSLMLTACFASKDHSPGHPRHRQWRARFLQTVPMRF